MNPIQIHLAINHLPLFGLLFSVILMGYGMLAAKDEIRKAALVGMLLTALATPVAFFSGEKSEDRVEKLSGVYEDRIDEHEEAGEWALGFMVGLGIMATAQLGLYLLPNSARFRIKTAWALIAIALLALATMARTAQTGGHIRHGEELGVQPGESRLHDD